MSVTPSTPPPSPPFPYAHPPPLYIPNVIPLVEKCDALVRLVAPTRQSDECRGLVYQYVKNIIEHTMTDVKECFQYGSSAFKTYLPDSDVDIGVILPTNNPNSSSNAYAQSTGGIPQPSHSHSNSHVNGHTSHTNENGHHQHLNGINGTNGTNGTDPEDAELASFSLSSSSSSSPSNVPRKSPGRSDSSREFFERIIGILGQQPAIERLTFVDAAVKLCKCQIGPISVDISANTSASLSSLMLFESIDSLINQSYLYKRTLLLIKAWCHYEGGILASFNSLLSSYALQVLTAWIFNLYHKHIVTPLDGLAHFLYYYSSFDFDSYCVTVHGPLKLSSIYRGIDDPLSAPEPILTHAFFEDCYARYNYGTPFDNTTPFTTGLFNVRDPWDPSNNCGRSVSPENARRIRDVFTRGWGFLTQVLSAFEHLNIHKQNQRAEAPSMEGISPTPIQLSPENAFRFVISAGDQSSEILIGSEADAISTFCKMFKQTFLRYEGRPRPDIATYPQLFGSVLKTLQRSSSDATTTVPHPQTQQPVVAAVVSVKDLDAPNGLSPPTRSRSGNPYKDQRSSSFCYGYIFGASRPQSQSSPTPSQSSQSHSPPSPIVTKKQNRSCWTPWSSSKDGEPSPQQRAAELDSGKKTALDILRQMEFRRQNAAPHRRSSESRSLEDILHSLLSTPPLAGIITMEDVQRDPRLISVLCELDRERRERVRIGEEADWLRQQAIRIFELMNKDRERMHQHKQHLNEIDAYQMNLAMINRSHRIIAANSGPPGQYHRTAPASLGATATYLPAPPVQFTDSQGHVSLQPPT